MSKVKTENSYFIKNSDSKLILVSEYTILKLIKNKRIMPSSKVFSKVLNSWLKVSDLSIYKNKSKLINSDNFSDDVNFEFANKNDPSVHIINLIDKLDDAKEVIFNSRFENIDKYNKLSIANKELQSKLNDAKSNKVTLELKNNTLQNKIVELEKEKINELKKVKFSENEMKYIELQAEVNNLKKKNKLIELDFFNEVETNNSLLIKIENIKEECLEVYERNEFQDTEIKKHEKERLYYKSNMDIIKKEVKDVHLEKNVVQSQFEEILNKYKLQDQQFNNLKKDKNELESLILNLKGQLKDKERLIDELREIPPTPVNLINEKLNLENNLLKNKIKEKEKLINKNMNIIEDLRLEISKYLLELKNIKRLKKSLSFYQNSFNILYNKTKSIIKKLHISQEQVLKLKNREENSKYRNIINLKENKKVSKHISHEKNTIFENPLLNENSIGKLFKLDISKTWKISLSGFTDEIYTIFEIKNIIKDAQDIDNIKVKKLGSNWNKIDKCLELNTEILKRNSHGVEEYFIERKSIRIPVHKLVEVQSSEVTLKGLCLNISNDGCLIEYKNKLHIKNKDHIKVLFYDEEDTIEAHCKVMNIISNSDIFSVGLQFVSISSKLKNWIDSQISDNLKEFNELKSA